MEPYLLTIAIPTYNGAKTISRVLDSLLWIKDERIELMVINNCSTDNTLDVVYSYQKRIPNLVVVNQKRNIGPDANFLDCYRRAKGKYIHLMSDDDIYFDNAINQIIGFLEKHDNLSLVYLRTVGYYGENIFDERELSKKVNSYVTQSKIDFMSSAAHYWGFLASFICSKKDFEKIHNAEDYFGTYWLQSYIHALCAQSPEAQLGVIGNPCIGAGRYLNVNSFDSSLIDGRYYYEMMMFAVENCGFDKKQMTNLWKDRFYMLTRHNIVKEKAIGIKRLSYKNIIHETWHFPSAWMLLYPFFLIPDFVCKAYNKYYRRKRGVFEDGRINREG